MRSSSPCLLLLVAFLALSGTMACTTKKNVTVVRPTRAFPPNTPPLFIRAEGLYARFRDLRLDEVYKSSRAFGRALKQKASIFKQAHRTYQDLAQQSKGTWKLAGYTRDADLHYDFAKTMYRAPTVEFEDQLTDTLRRKLIQRGVPRRLHEQAIRRLLPRLLSQVQRQFRFQLIRQGNYFAKRSIQLYQQCLQAAQSLQLTSSSWSQRCKRQLSNIRFRKIPATSTRNKSKKSDKREDYKALPFPWLH